MKLDKEKLSIAMAKNCCSLEELASKSEVSAVTIVRARNATQDPRPQTIGKLAKALQVDVTELIED